jgi:hypothetical protein
MNTARPMCRLGTPGFLLELCLTQLIFGGPVFKTSNALAEMPHSVGFYCYIFHSRI